MEFEDYSEDAICSAMQLGPFEPVARNPVVRVLLMPSFDPEVCVTCQPGRLHVVALHTPLFDSPPGSADLKHYEAAATLYTSQFAELVEKFDRAMLEFTERDQNLAQADGMGLIAIKIDGTQRSMFEWQPRGKPVRSLIINLVCLADAAEMPIQLRNRLVRCGQFAGLQWDTQPDPA